MKRIRKCLVRGLAVLTVSCSGEGDFIGPAGVVTQDYFPVDPDLRSGVSESQLRWYSQKLRTLELPPLPPLAADDSREIHRFNLLPSKGGIPRSVCLSRVEDGYQISHTSLAGIRPADVGTVEWQPVTATANLTRAQVRSFDRQFRRINFFAQPTGQPEDRGLDGYEWILESVRDGRYHVVERWTPRRETDRRGLTAFVAACEWLLANAPAIGEQDRPE